MMWRALPAASLAGHSAFWHLCPGTGCPADAELPFQITVDGELVAGDTLPVVCRQQQAAGRCEVRRARCASHAQCFDRADARRPSRPAMTIGFLGSLNYAAWMAKGEIRIFERGKNSQDGSWS